MEIDVKQEVETESSGSGTSEKVGDEVKVKIEPGEGSGNQIVEKVTVSRCLRSKSNRSRSWR